MLAVENLQPIFIYALLYIVSIVAVENDEIEFVCPYNGHLTGINYRYTVTINQIEFVCSSPNGNHIFGPYGTNKNGKEGFLRCPLHNYISSFYGSSATKLNHLGIRCRHQTDLYGEGMLVGEIGNEVGTKFDGSSLSLGRTPLSGTVKVTKNGDIVSVQVNYNDDLNNEDCRSEWTPRRGVTKPYEIIEVMECPDDGTITDFNFDINNDASITSITLFCSSSEGRTTITKGTKGIEHPRLFPCDKKTQYVRYFTGLYTDSLTFLNGACRLRSVSINEPLGSTESTASLKNYTNRIDGTAFDDECYAQHRRPFKVRIFRFDTIHAIQIQYKSIGVEVDCDFTRIQVIGVREDPELFDHAIIGATFGSTCSTLTQQLSLSILQSRSDSKKEGDGTSSQGDIFFIPLKWEREFGYDDKKVKAETTLSINGGYTYHNNHDSTSTRTNSNQTATTETATINYSGPGVAAIVGYEASYYLKSSPKVDILKRFRCREGSKIPEQGEMELSGRFYGSVFFQDYHFPFSNTTECTTKLRLCISTIKLDRTVSKRKLLETKLKTEINRCMIGKTNR